MKILSGVFEGVTTGTPISLLIENVDQRSKDYSDIKDKFRPGHADYTYWKKYGIRDYRGGGRSSARETAVRVAAGAVARIVLGAPVVIRGALVQIGPHAIDRAKWGPRTRQVQSTRPATDGTYSFSVFAGEYYVAALTDLENEDLSNPAFLEQLVPGAIRITVADGEKKRQDFRIVGR